MVTQPLPAEGSDAPAETRQPALVRARDRLLRDLLSPIDIASIVFFRIAFGVLAFWHVWLIMPAVHREYIEPDFHLTYYGLGWIQPLPGELMNVVLLLMAASALCIALGLFYRYAAAAFFALHTYAFLIDVANYWNHYYLVSLLGFLLIFVPANRAFSLDVARGAVSHSDEAPAWCLWILRGQMAIVYFFAGLAKLTSSDWWDGHPMDFFLGSAPNFPLIGRWFDESWMIHLASYSGMLFDLLIVPLLLWPRTRILAIAMAVVFHLSNSLIFDIEVFPWLALAATLIFLPPSWPRLAGQWRALAPPSQPVSSRPRLSIPQRAVAGVLLVYFVVQLLLPLRNFAYPGNSLWTSEGYFFSWRMLLANRSAAIVFYLRSNTADATCELKSESYVYGFQSAWFSSPDVVLQFAHHVASEYKKRGADVAVHAWTDYSLNGRSHRVWIDPEVDLASQKRTLGHHSWLRDLDDPSRTERPTAPPCPDPLPLERIRQIEQSTPAFDRQN